MLTSERREKKQGKIRNSEYYGMEFIFDTLYAESRNGKTFNHLMEIIESEENIKLAYRTIKRNHGSKTPGVDKKTIRNLAKLSEDEYVRLVKKKFSNYHPRPVRREEIPRVMEKPDHWGFRRSQTVSCSNVYYKSWSQSAKRSSVKILTDSAQIVPQKQPLHSVAG